MRYECKCREVCVKGGKVECHSMSDRVPVLRETRYAVRTSGN